MRRQEAQRTPWSFYRYITDDPKRFLNTCSLCYQMLRRQLHFKCYFRDLPMSGITSMPAAVRADWEEDYKQLFYMPLMVRIYSTYRLEYLEFNLNISNNFSLQKDFLTSALTGCQFSCEDNVSIQMCSPCPILTAPPSHASFFCMTLYLEP